jgi:flagellar hook-associated protein 1 FlgK
MSLTAGLYSAVAGISNASARIATTSNNVTNADNPGYTRKIYQAEYITNNTGTLPIDGTVVSAILNPYLQEALIEDVSVSERDNVISEYLSDYVRGLGTPDGEITLNGSMDRLAQAFETLLVTPENVGTKYTAIAEAQKVASDLRNMSSNIQDLRRKTDIEISQGVDAINASVRRIDDLNKEISLSQSTGRSTANFEDQRREELETLAQYINIDFFTNSQGQVNVYTSNGMPLLDSNPRAMTYSPTTFVTGATVYPGGFDNIELNGLDITSTIRGGTIGGLIEMRDTILVEEQDKLNEFARVLMNDINGVLNQGASFPSPSTITGDTPVVAADPVGTGAIRVATTDASGQIQGFSDFNLGGFANIGALVAAINGTAGLNVNASINADGNLVFSSTVAGEGVVVNDNTVAPAASDVGPDNLGFMHYYGMNNLFTLENGAEDILVSQDFLDNSDNLPVGRLSNDPALAVGDIGVPPGEGTIADLVNNQFTTATNFGAAGNFASQTATLDQYTDLIMSNAATRAKEFTTQAATSLLSTDTTRNTLDNLSGVNIDEELTYLIQIEEQYQAAATMISRIQELFDELLAAVR